MTRPIPYARALIRGLVVTGVTLGFTCAAPRLAAAQDVPSIPSSATEPEGLVAEPAFITRATLFADRHFGKGDITNGFYVDFANMIPGAGWLSAGPGYRHWYKQDKVFVDASAAISWRGYKTGQARFELPAIARSRLALGTQVRWQNFSQIDHFGTGPATTADDRTQYGLESTNVVGFATLRPMRWMDLTAQAGWLKPTVTAASGPFLRDFPATPDAFGRFDPPTFVPTEVSLTIDGRDFPSHPTRGILLRGAAARYDDRETGVFTHKRYESEAAGFLPIAGGRLVLALHGWAVTTETGANQVVPFFLQPSLGGANTLRGYADYRFHDRNMLVVNAEARLALMTHMDLAFFADAGNVAAERRDLDLAKKSYGAGLRLHTRRMTYARIDAARGDEGWRFLFRLTDPLDLARLTRRSGSAPFVP
jgi:outer membrane protein assembly factor BamA